VFLPAPSLRTGSVNLPTQETSERFCHALYSSFSCVSGTTIFSSPKTNDFVESQIKKSKVKNCALHHLTFAILTFDFFILKLIMSYSKSELQDLYDFYSHQLVNDTVPYWFPRSFDNEYGGFLLMRDADGSLIDDDKAVWIQGRATWYYLLCITQ
jgi:hypothetical protein